MKIIIPKLFIGEKKKGRYTPETKFFKGKTSIEAIQRFFEGEKITHAKILSRPAALYDPIGFASPIKVFGSFICRRALIESSGDPLREVGETSWGGQRMIFLSSALMPQ